MFPLQHTTNSLFLLGGARVRDLGSFSRSDKVPTKQTFPQAARCSQDRSGPGEHLVRRPRGVRKTVLPPVAGLAGVRNDATYVVWARGPRACATRLCVEGLRVEADLVCLRISLVMAETGQGSYHYLLRARIYTNMWFMSVCMHVQM